MSTARAWLTCGDVPPKYVCQLGLVAKAHRKATTERIDWDVVVREPSNAGFQRVSSIQFGQVPGKFSAQKREREGT
jgi:hypothetical protein